MDDNKMLDVYPNIDIDLSAVKDNYLAMSKLAGPKTLATAVVKANSYGIGAKEVSKTLYEVGCRDFWVAYVREALEIRKVLPLDANIYYLQGFQHHELEITTAYNIIPVINSISEFNNAKGHGISFVIHVDSGLSRIGIRPHEIDALLPEIGKENISYVISHMACSDELANPMNKTQKILFDNTIRKIRTVNNVKAGISATHGTLLGEPFCYDMVRIGAFLYGINMNNSISPKNVVSIRGIVLQTYELDPNQSVGYGATFKTSRKTRVAIVSIGYADGINRALSNRGVVLFYGTNNELYKAPIIGKISMDMTTCDITDIPEDIVKEYATGFILNNDYTINDMAKDSGTTPYEILTGINFHSERISKHYTQK